jgi:hypothetical protein
MRNITIKVIPDSKQRHETAGDYWIDKRGTIQVRISKSKNCRYEALVLIHELFLCKPGDDPKAPYHREHRFATRIERLLARELRVNWATYEAGL